MGLFDFFKKKQTRLEDIEIDCDVAFLMNSDELIEHFVGDIYLPSGKIVSADPFISDHTKPFVKTVKPGTYPVNLYLKKQGEDHYRIAFSKIKFKQEKATRWILALTERDKIETVQNLKPDEILGFPVDAGLAFFADNETHKVYLKKSDELYAGEELFNYYDDVLYDEMVAASAGSIYGSKDGDWANHTPDATFKGNMIIHSSGWGDGYYPVYWGLNNKNEIVELAMDFFVVSEQEQAILTEKRFETALKKLLKMPSDGFIIFQCRRTEKFVQFALTQNKDLLFDLPTHSLSDEEKEYLQPIVTKENCTYEHQIYNKVFGKDIKRAASLVSEIFTEVYLLDLDDDIEINFS
ncbi:DUF4241 domain-containing protein [uncultured Kordia sp.]|uniref:DUF4241 domain-containing protein n=1 Tax=uncultured Kordia sp. TaxID=507699 RepID=UPI00261EF2F1|nr:DUF4241 domain-containing protein [uncultured Kordia sp.]